MPLRNHRADAQKPLHIKEADMIQWPNYKSVILHGVVPMVLIYVEIYFDGSRYDHRITLRMTEIYEDEA